MEVFASVYSFDKPKKTAIQLSGVKAQIHGDVARNHYIKLCNFKPSLDLQVSLIEASLISYFNTKKYNTHYIDFPHNHYKSLIDFYEIDFAALIVIIDNENIGMQKIFSETVKSSHHHEIRIDFRKLEGNPSLFEKT